MQRIVITGGSGFVGTAVCERLAQALPGTRVVVPTRHPAHARGVATLPNVDVLPWCVDDPAGLSAALPALLQGADALVHLVAILHGSAEQFDAVHVRLPRTLAAAARAAGVRRVVQVSALGVAADAPSHYLRSKAAGEAAWRAEPGLDVRILRPSVIFGRDDRFTNLFARLLRRLPVMPLAGAEARFQPVWVGDVAAAVVALLRDDAPGGTAQPVVQAAGPEELTLGQIVRGVGAMAGCPRPVLPLPEWAGRVQAGLMGLLPGEPLMSRDNLLSMRVPNVARDDLPGLPDLGIAPTALAWMAPHLAPARPDYAAHATHR